MGEPAIRLTITTALTEKIAAREHLNFVIIIILSGRANFAENFREGL
jgi:hypothetical protein